MPGMMQKQGAHGRGSQTRMCCLPHKTVTSQAWSQAEEEIKVVKTQSGVTCKELSKARPQGCISKLPHPRLPLPALSVWPGPGDPLAPQGETSPGLPPQGLGAPWGKGSTSRGAGCSIGRGRGVHLPEGGCSIGGGEGAPPQRLECSIGAGKGVHLPRGARSAPLGRRGAPPQGWVLQQGRGSAPRELGAPSGRGSTSEGLGATTGRGSTRGLGAPSGEGCTCLKVCMTSWRWLKCLKKGSCRAPVRPSGA